MMMLHILLLVITILYALYRHKNRRKFQLAKQFNGPTEIPIIGNVLVFMNRTPSGTLRILFWYMGQRLTKFCMCSSRNRFVFPKGNWRIRFHLQSMDGQTTCLCCYRSQSLWNRFQQQYEVFGEEFSLRFSGAMARIWPTIEFRSKVAQSSVSPIIHRLFIYFETPMSHYAAKL